MGEVIPLEQNLDICRILGREVSECFATEELTQETEAALGFVFGRSTYLSVQLVLGQQVYLSLGLLPKDSSCSLLLFHEDRSVAGICVQSEAMASCRASLERNHWLQDITNVHRVCQAQAVTTVPMFLDVSGKRKEVALQMLTECTTETLLDTYLDLANGVCIGSVTVGFQKVGEEQHLMRIVNNAILLSLSLAPHVLQDADQLLLNVALYTQLISPAHCYEFIPGYGHVPADDGGLTTVNDMESLALASDEEVLEDEAEQSGQKQGSNSSCMPCEHSNNGDPDGAAPGAVITFSSTSDTESEVDRTKPGCVEQGDAGPDTSHWQSTDLEQDENHSGKTRMQLDQHRWLLYFSNFKLESLYINQMMGRVQVVNLLHLVAILLHLLKYRVQAPGDAVALRASLFLTVFVMFGLAATLCVWLSRRRFDRRGLYWEKLFVFLDFMVLCIVGPALYAVNVQEHYTDASLRKWFVTELICNILTPCALMVRWCWSAPLTVLSSIGWLMPTLTLCSSAGNQRLFDECFLFNWGLPVLGALSFALPWLWASERRSRKVFCQALSSQPVTD